MSAETKILSGLAVDSHWAAAGSLEGAFLFAQACRPVWLDLNAGLIGLVGTTKQEPSCTSDADSRRGSDRERILNEPRLMVQQQHDLIESH